MNKLFEWDGGVSDGYLFSYLVLNFPFSPSFDKWSRYVFKRMSWRNWPHCLSFNQLKLYLVLSVLGPFTFTRHPLSLGNGEGHLKARKDLFLLYCRLMIITGAITLLTAVAFWCVILTNYWASLHKNRFLFPDSPTTAWFLTTDERAKAILRIRTSFLG